MDSPTVHDKTRSTKWVRVLVVFWVLVWIGVLSLLYEVNAAEERGYFGCYLTVETGKYETAVAQYGQVPVSKGTASAWMIGTVTLAGITFFYARRRFSLGALVILIVLAGASGLIPRCFERRTPRGGHVEILNYASTVYPMLLTNIRQDFKPGNTIFGLPKPLIGELQLSPSMIDRVEVTMDAPDWFALHLTFANDLSREQVATLFHMYAILVEHALEKSARQSGTTITKADRGSDEYAAVLGSRLGPYLNQWRAEMDAADTAKP